MNYPVADLLIKIKNACFARRKKVFVPSYKVNKEILTILVKERYLESMKETKVKDKKVLEVIINYEGRRSVLTGVSLVSKPSLRVYIGSSDIPKIQKKNMHGLVLSTNKGIMTGNDAYKKSLGGEFLFEIW